MMRFSFSMFSSLFLLFLVEVGPRLAHSIVAQNKFLQEKEKSDLARADAALDRAIDTIEKDHEKKEKDPRYQKLQKRSEQQLQWLHAAKERASGAGGHGHVALGKNIVPFLVSHRGYHSDYDDPISGRPIDNTLPAFEQLWSAGFIFAECDVTITADGEILVNHDDTLERLAAEPRDPKSKRRIPGKMTFQDIVTSPLKSGMRAPTLKEVLESAHTIGPHAKLVIELKYISTAPTLTQDDERLVDKLVEFCVENPHLVPQIALFMGFMPKMMTELRLRYESATNANFFQGKIANNVDRPLFMLLTGSRVDCGTGPDCPGLPVEPVYDIDEPWPQLEAKLHRFLKVNEHINLDGVYIEYDKGMSSTYLENLKKTTGTIIGGKKIVVGVWMYGRVRQEPDSYREVAKLVDAGARFVNTDFQAGFFKDATGVKGLAGPRFDDVNGPVTDDMLMYSAGRRYEQAPMISEEE